MALTLTLGDELLLLKNMSALATWRLLSWQDLH
jgi:hypothetical protein